MTASRGVLWPILGVLGALLVAAAVAFLFLPAGGPIVIAL